MALSKITTASLSDDSVDTAQIADDAIESAQLANNVAISTSGDVTTTGNVTVNTALKLRGDTGALHFRRTTSEADIAKIQYVNGNPSLDIGADGKNVRFTNGGSYAETMRVGTNGDVTVQNGNLIIGTSGKGIDFSATSDSFNANGNEQLTDYERGAYNLSTNGFVQQTTSQGSYVRVGNLCFFYVFLHANGSQNSLGFTCNVPFTVASNNASNNSGYYSNAVAPAMHYRVDTGTAGMVAYVVAGTNYFKLYQNNVDGDWVQMTNNYFTSEDQAHISGCYIVA